MQATSARTQSTQTIYRSGDEQFAPDTGILNPCQPRQQICPAAADFPRGQERCWRGIGDRKSPVSFQPPPRGVNKIYKCDVVFFIEESNTNDHSQPQFPYNAPAGSNKIYTCDVVFHIGEARTKTTSQTQFPYKNCIACVG